jgi:hypothetical protein
MVSADLAQQVVEGSLVLAGVVGDRRRQREHRVIVRQRQRGGFAVGDQLLYGGALALRAVSVAAGVVGDFHIRHCSRVEGVGDHMIFPCNSEHIASVAALPG